MTRLRAHVPLPCAAPNLISHAPTWSFVRPFSRYMYGFFKNKRIVLYDTLLEQSTDEQVTAVLCHELGHWSL